jgi:predicted O-linked N-acetylglucosamine transferase (SPINDLY family)
MAAVDDAVLWLVADNDAVARNLRRSAACGGIAPERLIFARRLPYSMHLGRLRLADLCLDSLPFNAGTTASDALWAGVPLLTCAGRGLAARMAGSLLRAAGMPELVTQRIDEYESLAMRLAGDRAALAQLRAKLAANRLHAPLFDTGRFCTAVELAYSRMVEGHRRGDAPAHFAVGG